LFLNAMISQEIIALLIYQQMLLQLLQEKGKMHYEKFSFF